MSKIIFRGFFSSSERLNGLNLKICYIIRRYFFQIRIELPSNLEQLYEEL